MCLQPSLYTGDNKVQCKALTRSIITRCMWQLLGQNSITAGPRISFVAWRTNQHAQCYVRIPVGNIMPLRPKRTGQATEVRELFSEIEHMRSSVMVVKCDCHSLLYEWASKFRRCTKRRLGLFTSAALLSKSRQVLSSHIKTDFAWKAWQWWTYSQDLPCYKRQTWTKVP